MQKHSDLMFTMVGDLLAVVLSWYVFYFLRFEIGLFQEIRPTMPATLIFPALIMGAYWLVIFAVFGRYRKLYLQSRFDEIIGIGKISLLGTLILFFLLFIDDMGWNQNNLTTAKEKTALYWILVFGFVSASRLVVRTTQKWRVRRGLGLHNALIVGTGPLAQNVQENLRRQPISGMRVLGFVALNGKLKNKLDAPILGPLKELKSVVRDNDIEEVIVALEPEEKERLVEVLQRVDMPNISVKILPDFHQVITGMNKTNQIFGLPLIEVLPDPMPTWEKVTKRVFDSTFSLLVLVLFFPLWILVALLIRITSSGPAVYQQKRVGVFGKKFTIYKFRTMYSDAEVRSGPVWATANDPRITPLGFWLRKLRIDEVPQFWNVLKGEMSLVGPRPERPYFVEQFEREIPLYTRRLRVKPGITGWAQVKWKYDASLEDVKEKTKYDLFYVENMSLRMDFKILLNTILTVLGGKGK